MDGLNHDVFVYISSFLECISLIRLLQLQKRHWSLRGRIHTYHHTPVYRELSNKKEWEAGLLAAIPNNDMEMIKFFIHKGACNFKVGLEKAAEQGTQQILNFFLELVPPSISKWNEIMKGAATAGNQHLFEWALKPSKATNPYWWTVGLHFAALGGHLDLMKYFLEKHDSYSLGEWAPYRGTIFPDTELSEKLSGGWVRAIQSGDLELVKELHGKDPNFHYSPDVGLITAAHSGHRNLVDYFIRQGATNFTEAAIWTLKHHYPDLESYLRSLNPEAKPCNQ